MVADLAVVDLAVVDLAVAVAALLSNPLADAAHR